MNVPGWYALILLALAAWRTYSLIAEDTILDRPRRWALRLGSDWEPGKWPPGDPRGVVPEAYRAKWALFITCPRCAGFWIGLVWLAAYQITMKWALIAAVPFALNALVIVFEKFVSDEDE